ncbi:MAG: hypothetical protein IPN34_08880 [Planctomycetes bacterium]|nr:hypothetical protein [Planctomycetota bacterium]
MLCSRSMPALALTAAVALGFASCSQAPSNEPASPTAAESPGGAQDPARQAADEAAVKACQAKARAAFEAQDWDGAFDALDELLALRPEDASGWELLGQVSMASAPGASQPGLVFRDAASAFARAFELGGSADLAFLASRASRYCPDPDGALRWARTALQKKDLPSPEQRKIAIEALFDAYAARQQAGEDASALASETFAQLVLLNAAAERETSASEQRALLAWGRDRLATLHQMQGEIDKALAERKAIVAASPNDEAAHTALIALLRETGGFEASAAFYQEFRAAHLDHALATWFEGVERFERGSELYNQGQDGTPWFERAEWLFREARSLEPQWQERCIAYELVSRAGVGYSKMTTAADDDDARLGQAEEAFFSMEDLAPGGLDAQYPGKLLSGVYGLQLLAEKGNRTEGNNLIGPALDRAARIYRRLHEARPQDANLANNCGYFHREIGVAQAQAARAGGEGAAEMAEKARATLAICRDAYLAAAALAPDDVRIVNDAALILLYHYPSRIEEAERLLRQAKEKGEVQLQSADMDPEARDLLTEAYGDAHQNLGLLFLAYRSDPEQAEPFYRRAVEIGPERAGRRAETVHIFAAIEKLRRGETTPLEELDPRIWHVE